MSVSFSFSQGWMVTRGRYLTPSEAPTAAASKDLKVKVYPNWLRHVALEWSLPAGAPSYLFHVYIVRSEGSYERLTTSPVDDTTFINPVSREFSKLRFESYVVEAIDPTTGLSVMRSFPTTWENEVRSLVERKLSEIQRREYLLLTKFTGVKSFFFRRKSFGKHCPRCWSTQTESVTDDTCPICLGTGFDGGYYNPVPIYLQYEPTPSNRLLTPYGKTEPNVISAWTISVPQVYPGDVIFRSGDWASYTVVAIQTTEMQAKTVRQTLSLSQLSKMTVESALASRVIADDSGSYLSVLQPNFPQRNPVSHITSTTSDDPAWTSQVERQITPIKYSL